MEPSQFVGRVGGLAVALGVGVAAFSGTAVAWADRSDSGADSSTTSTSAGSDSGAAGTPRHRGPMRGAATTRPIREVDSTPTPAPEPTTPPAVDPEPAEAVTPTVEPVVAPAPVETPVEPVETPVEPVVAPVQRVGTQPVTSVPVTARPAAVTVIEPEPMVIAAPVAAAAPTPAQAGQVSAFASPAGTGSAGDVRFYPGLPDGSPLEWGLLAFVRRQEMNGLAGWQLGPSPITVNPTTELVDGVIQGTLQATSGSGDDLKISTVGIYAADGGKLNLGTVPVSATEKDPQSFTVLPYGTWLDPGGAKGVQEFDVRITEVTPFDTAVTDLPWVGATAASIITLLQQLPLISDLLAPLIGSSIIATVSVDVEKLAPGATPVAFTYRVKSFDGTLIRTNFFPAADIAAGETAPVVLFGPGLGGAGVTDPYGESASEGFVPNVSDLRGAGYNVVTWDPRGEYDSGGILQLDNPFFEGRDASAIISWSAENPLIALDGPGDPAAGMVGGSYGGGIQLVTASTDPRVDAIVPGIAWHSLVESLYPSETFKTAWGNFLILALQVLPQVEGAEASRINNLIYQGVLTGDLFGWVSQTLVSFAASSGPTVLLNKMQAPTLLVQGTFDALFPLSEAVANAETIMANPYDTPVNMIWFCGGHGLCTDPENPDQKAEIYRDTISWLDRYVGAKSGLGTAAGADLPTFQWYDQKGRYHSSDLMPFEPGFNRPDPYRTTGQGGTLGIIPLIGGAGSSGNSNIPFPINVLLGFESSKAENALNLEVKPGVGTQIVGAPTLSFTYSGLGTSRAVFAQLVDNKTGRVLGSIVTAVPVTLDGKTHTVRIPMQQIAYTVDDPQDSLTLQIAGSATLFQNSSVGVIDISDVVLDLPVRATV